MKCLWFCWCSLYGSWGLAFLFLESLRIAQCVFIVSINLAATLWQTTGGPVSQSLSAFGFGAGSWWKCPPSGPSPESALIRSWWASPPVSLNCALICYTSGNWFSRISHVKNLYKTDVVLNKNKKNNVYNAGEENVFIHVQISYIQNKSLWLLSVGLLVEFWLRSLSCKISVFLSTVDQISVTNFCHFANTHFPSKCMWEWEGSTLSLLSSQHQKLTFSQNQHCPGKEPGEA